MKAVAAFVLVLCSLAVSQAWNCREGPRLHNALQIDAGQGKVVANGNYYAYFLIGNRWFRLSTLRFRHVTVGPAGLWATGINWKVYKYVAGHFLRSSGPSMRYVDAGGDDQIVGITTSWYAYCMRSTYAEAYRARRSQRWNNLKRRMRYYSCSPRHGCWGVDLSFKVYHTQRMSPTNCGTANWRYIGRLKMKVIEVGTDGRAIGVTTSGKVYERVGISLRYPFGRGWRYVPMCMSVRHVSYDLGRLWVVTTSGLVMYCY